MKYQAKISMVSNLKRLKSLLKNEDNVYLDAAVSIPPVIRISASTKQALENRIERCQASLLACGFIPMMFDVERWED
jgi:hypothetical protein